MNKREYLLKKYKSKIIPGEKSIQELIDFLKQKADITEISATDLEKSIMWHIMFNVIHSLRNQQFNLTADELDFAAYKLTKNAKNDLYYQSSHTHIYDDEEDDIIYVVFEIKTGCIHSNSNKLLLELFIEQGVSESDYQHQTIVLDAYLTYLDWYSNGQY